MRDIVIFQTLGTENKEPSQNRQEIMRQEEILQRNSWLLKNHLRGKKRDYKTWISSSEGLMGCKVATINVCRSWI